MWFSSSNSVFYKKNGLAKPRREGHNFFGFRTTLERMKESPLVVKIEER